MNAYKLHGVGCSLDNKIGDVANEVSIEGKVEKHEEEGEGHFHGVDSMEVSIAHSGEGGDGPVHGCCVSLPCASVFQVWIH